MSRRNSTLMTDVATAWTALDNSSCLPQQVADAIYCFWQQRQNFDVFSAAQTIQQAVVFQLLCMSCGPATWPLPFTFEDVWMNFYVAIGLALNVMAFALVQVGKKTHGTEVQRGALQLLKGKLWQDATGATFHRSLDFIRPLHLQGLHSCPVDLGPSWLMDGKLQVDKRHMAETIKLQACQSGVLCNIQNRANRLHSRLQQSRENIFSALLVLPLSDLSFHISVAVRTWYGGSLMLVHHILGGPSNVTILLADDNEVEEFARLPRAMRYGGNHGGLGVSKILGNLRQLFSSLSDSDPIWLSTASRLSLAFKTAVWGFPTVGIAHGRTAEHDCSGDFCYGLRRYWAPGVPVVTLRAPLDGWLRSWQRHVHRIDAPLKFFLVQRSRKLSRRLVAPERLASSWSRALRGQLKILFGGQRCTASCSRHECCMLRTLWQQSLDRLVAWASFCVGNGFYSSLRRPSMGPMAADGDGI